MKTKLFIFGILAATLLVSCTPPNPKPNPIPVITKEELQVYLDSLKAYFPYSIDEEFVFKNEDLDSTWVATAYDYAGGGTYPHTMMVIDNDEDCECYGGWQTEMSAWLVNPDWTPHKYNPSRISVDAVKEAGGNTVHLIWDCDLRFAAKKYFITGLFLGCSQDEILSLLADTMYLLPLEPAATEPVTSMPDGPYVRIVKHQGLTDFSTDGKTVWRRVK